ncbi:MAG: hypothetical protein V7L12_07570 [Nostoc sp.]
MMGWDRNTIRKGIRELTSGIICVDNYSVRGRYVDVWGGFAKVIFEEVTG